MRRFRTVFIILAAMFLFTGCHGAEEKLAFTIPEEFDTSRDYEITFWAKNDTNKAQVDIYEKTISDFEELYPNIHVNLRLYTDYSKIYNDVITNIATSTTPNVCITYPDHIATYMTGENVVVPLDELLTDEKYGCGGSEIRFDAPRADEIVPKFLNEGILSGHYYALPFMRSTEACYVNRTYVEKLGYTLPETLTWDFVWEVSEKAAEYTTDETGKIKTYKVNGQNVMIPFIYKSTDNMMIQMLKQKGAGYSKENGEIDIFNDTTRELLYGIADATKKGSFSTFKISSYPANFLNAGQCIFAIDSTAGATWMGSKAPHLDISPDKLVEFDIEVMPIPQFDTENPSMISQGPSLCLFNKEDSQEVLASWFFAQFLLTNDMQIDYSETEGYIPVTTKAHNSEKYQQYLAAEGSDSDEHYSVKIQAAKLLLANTENTFVTPVFNGSASLRDAAGQLIENVTKSTRRKETVDEAYMEKLFDDVTDLYRLNLNRGDGAVGANGKKVLGELPGAAVALITAIIVTWVLIIAYVVWGKIRKKKN